MKKEMPFVKNRNDAVVAVIFLLFSIAYGIGAQHLPKAHLEEVIEANVYPFVLAILLAALSLLLLFGASGPDKRAPVAGFPPKK